MTLTLLGGHRLSVTRTHSDQCVWSTDIRPTKHHWHHDLACTCLSAADTSTPGWSCTAGAY